MDEPILLVDADQHYFEPDDCCSRHLEPRFADHAVRVVTGADGRREWRAGARPFDIERHPRDRTLAPGELERSLSAKERGEGYTHVLIDGGAPDYTDRDVRVELLDGWGIERAVLFPTAGLAWDAQLADAPDAACATARAFNRWIEEDWGWTYRDRLYSSAFISLADPALACAELDRVLAAGARIVQIRTGPVQGRSAAHPDFDGFWARVSEADIPVALHITVSGYERTLSELWGEDPTADHSDWSGFQWYATFATRPITDTLAALIFHNLFGRFPRVKILSVENGSRWVRPLLEEMDAAYRFVAGPTAANWVGGPITDRPSELFKRHVYVAPFLDRGHEAPVGELVELIGADRVIFGSDWPHGEGRDTPRSFDTELAGIDDATLHKVLRANTAGLLGLG